MTFKHKLSRRLALLRGVTRASALLALACITPPGDRLSGPGGPVNRVVIIPDSVVAQPNQEVAFVAVGLTTVGDTANVAVRWSVTDGTITEVGIRAGRAYGRYKPNKPGRHRVAVTDSGGRVDTATVDVPVPVASVTVTPTSASVMMGQATQLTATLRDSAGTVLTGRAVTWSSGNAGVATVNATGLVSGKGAGSTTITATCEGRNGSAGVTVTLPPVASVSVTPASTGVGLGQAVQLTATPRDASGNPLSGRVVTWSTSAAGTATVSASGLVTGVAAGAATITATSEGRSGTASVAVSAPGQTHEPPGFTRVTERSFDARVEDGWYDAGSSAFSIVSDGTAPRSPSNVGQVLFPAGYGSGNAPSQVEKWFDGGKRVYIRFWVKFSANWYGNDSEINKIVYAWIARGPRVYLQAAGKGTGSLYARVNTQAPGPDYSLGGGTAEIVRGRWHLFEVLLTPNSVAGGVDSRVQGWLDGAQFVDFTGSASAPLALWGAGESNTWEAVTWVPVYGGGGGPVPADQYQWIDHFYVSTGN